MIFLTKLKQQEVNNLIDRLSFLYDCSLDKFKKSSLYLNTKTQKIFLFQGDVNNINLERLNVLGLYFGTMHNNNRFRLSIDGSQLIEPKKNIVTLNEKSFKSYISGENLFIDEVEEISWEDKCPFLIVKYNNDNLGCCQIKDKEILCFVPKSRRLNSLRVF